MNAKDTAKNVITQYWNENWQRSFSTKIGWNGNLCAYYFRRGEELPAANRFYDFMVEATR